jgi:hypothetical protein
MPAHAGMTMKKTAYFFMDLHLMSARLLRFLCFDQRFQIFNPLLAAGMTR